MVFAQAASREGPRVDKDERARRCDCVHEIQDEIEEIRPTTLRGVLALLDYHLNLYEGDMYRFPPDCAAIEGLRDIIEREGRS